MNLMRIRYFVEAARSGSLTAAAQMLYTSQPNLSKQIALMEQELGFALFHRVGRTISLTKAGRYLYEQLADVPDRVDDATTHARALSRGEAGALSIGILEGQDVNAMLSDRLRSLREARPELTFQMERCTFSQLRQGLEDSHYDLIITLFFAPEDTRGLRFETLSSQGCGAVLVSRKNPLAALEHPTLTDFKDENFVAISPEESEGGYARLIDQCAGWGFTPKVVQRCSTLESILLCVETGLGVALLDRNTRLEHNAEIRIIPIPDSPASDVVAVWREDNQNPVVRKLVECLKG